MAVVLAVVIALGIYLNSRSSKNHDSSRTGNAGAATTASSPSTDTTPAGPSTPTSPARTSDGSAVPAQTSLGRWARTNLSTKTVIAADAAAAKTLKGAGFTGVVSVDSTTVDWRTVAFLIRNRNVGHPSALRTKLAAASAPLAYFGTGSNEVTVSQVYPDLGSDLPAALAHNATLGAQAAVEIRQNPNIRFSKAALQSLRTDGLDLRPASVLVMLAKSSAVYVVDIVNDPAEKRAGRPSRTIVISTGDLNMVQQTLSNTGLEYRPAKVVVIDQNAIELQWIPAIVAVAGG